MNDWLWCSVKLGKSRQPVLSSHVPTYVDSCLGFVRVIALPGINVGNCWGCVVWDVSVNHVGEYFWKTLWLNSLTCFQMICKKALLDQRPIIMMRKTGQPPRNFAIAAPKRIECVPISLAAIWRVSSLIAKLPSFNTFVMCLDVIFLMRSYFQMAGTRVSSLAPR